MIEDPDKTDRLTAEIEASLPLKTRLSPTVKRALAKQSPESSIPDRCMATKIFYLGDEGGIACGLDIAGSDIETPFIVSITHLIFDRRCPVFRQPKAYPRHRVKKLKQQNGRGY